MPTTHAFSRLTGAHDSAGNFLDYAYRCNGESRDRWGAIGWESDRTSQTVNGATTTYALDQAAGLTQVLADGASTYLYGLGRLGEQLPGGCSTTWATGWAACGSWRMPTGRG